MNHGSGVIKIFGIKLLFIFPIILYSLFIIHHSFAAEISYQDLKVSINEKTKALQEVNQQLLQTQKDLDKTEGKSETLQGEIKKSDYRINQLNLNIKSSEINIEKLGLEIKSLNYDIGNVKTEIDVKKAGITQFLKEIQKKDNENVIIILLKNRNLAENITEFENLSNLNESLSSSVKELVNLNEKMSDKLDLTSQKKNGIEKENKNLKNTKIIVTEEKNDKQQLLSQTKNQEKLYQKMISDLEKQQEAIAAEIEKIEAELRLKIDPNLLPTPRPGVLAYPVSGSTLTQGYGATSFAKYNYRGKWHNGLDFAAPIGTPVLAAEKGVIVEVWDQDKYCYRGAYGKFVVIEHENNLTTLYAHLSLATIKKGDYVSRGDIIGYVGNTGYSTGPHLHLTVYASQTFRIGPSKINCGPIMPFGGDLNPLQYL